MVELTEDHEQPLVAEQVFRLRPGRLMTAVWAASFVVIMAGLFREWYVTTFGMETIAKDLRHLAFNAEYCLPAWYTSLLLAISAALLALVTGSTARSGERYLFHWAGLALIFLGLSIDEATGIHEVAIEPLRNGLDLGGYAYFGWVLPGIALVAVAGLIYLPFLLAQPVATRRIFFLAGLIYVGGALGMELVGGKLLTLYGETSLPYQIAYCIEEIMEILGVTLFVSGLLGHLKRHFGGAVLVIT